MFSVIFISFCLLFLHCVSYDFVSTFAGWDFEVGFSGRSVVEGPFSAPIETSSVVLAAQRTRRKDPLDGFKRYTGGWNISERHYWAVSSSKLSQRTLLFAFFLLK